MAREPGVTEMGLGRWRSLVGLAVARVAGRLRTEPQRVLFAVLGVAIAVGLMVAVTGVSLGLASNAVVQSDDVDYWIVPEQADVESIAISSEGVKLGNVHATSARIADDDRVDYATPVLLELVPIKDQSTGERKYVLAAGVVPRQGSELMDLPVGVLQPGDPHYANGSYDGPWTGEVILNDAAASITNTSAGESVTLANSKSNDSFAVMNVSAGGTETAGGAVPVMVMQLSELQTITGTTEGDTADQILVSTNDPGVRSMLEASYPQTNVVTGSGLSAQQLSTSNLPLAVAVAALVSALLVGVLFVTTLMGLEVSADREELAMLAAIGLSSRSRSVLVACETLVVAVLGGIVGLGLGALGMVGINQLGAELAGTEAVAVFEPMIGVYAICVAVLIGVIGATYPVVLSRRTKPLEVLSR